MDVHSNQVTTNSPLRYYQGCLLTIIFLGDFNVDGGDSFENLQGGIMFFLEMDGEEWKN